MQKIGLINYLCAFKEENKSMKSLFVGLLLLFIAMILLGIGVFFSKKKEFPSGHIGDSEAMKERNIGCATSQDAEMRAKKNPLEELLKSDEYNYLH